MGAVLIAAWLAAGLDEDAAGRLYQGAMEKVASRRYEEAIKDFDAALAEEPEENAKLEYRDAAGVDHTIAYYPHYEPGQARALQAKDAATLEEQYRLIQDAVARLGKTTHPNKKASVERAYLESLRIKTALDASKSETPAPPPKPKTFEEEFARVQETVERLSSQERFEDALKTMEWEAPVFKDHDAEKDQLLGRIRTRQGEAVAKRLADLGVRLDGLAGEKGVPEAKAVGAALKAARVPPTLHRQPPPAFGWLERFLALIEKEGDRLGKAAALPAEEVQRLSGALDQAALAALDAGLLAGFRAAHRIAHSVRVAHVKGADAAGAGAFETAFQKSAATAEEALDRCAAELKRRREKAGTAEGTVKDLKDYEDRGLAEQRREVEELRQARRQRSETEGLAGRIKGLEGAVLPLASRPDAAPARNLAKDAAEVRTRPGFEALPPPARARAFLVQAVAEAAAAFLEGEAPDKAVERCRGSASEAFKLDPKVADPWRGRLSPKLLAVLDRAKGS